MYVERSDIMATGSINISSNISRNTLLANYPPNPCSNLIGKNRKTYVVLTWDDPSDYITADGTTIRWKYTRVVRKYGSAPRNESDGTIVTQSSIRNQYSVDGFKDTDMTSYDGYWYSVFSCSTNDVFSQVDVSVYPKSYKVMTVKIDLTNSNPARCGKYADDAINMLNGKGNDSTDAWQKFFGYRPCLFKDGKVVGYLNPNDYTKFEDGRDADITSGKDGNVMIEFPRRGLSISKYAKELTVSMTDDPDDSNFKYYAHQRQDSQKKYFYIGAYHGWYYDVNTSTAHDKLSSLSEKDCKYSHTDLESFYKLGVANGPGYGVLSYYQWVFIQSMYILQFKGNFDAQSTVGASSLSNTVIKTGYLNKKGMVYGDANHVKLFGIEDLYGYTPITVNNVVLGLGWKIFTTTDDTVIRDSMYKEVGTFKVDTNIGYMSGYATDCAGTPEAGFFPINSSLSGSTSTYFCDYTFIGRDTPSLDYGMTLKIGVTNSSNEYSTDDKNNGMFSYECIYFRNYGLDGKHALLQYL